MRTAILLLSLCLPAFGACGGTTYNVGSGQTYATFGLAFTALQADCGPGVAWTADNTIHGVAGTYTEKIVTAVGYLFNNGTKRLIYNMDTGVVVTGSGLRNFAFQNEGAHTTLNGGHFTNTTSNVIFSENAADDFVIIGAELDTNAAGSCLFLFGTHGETITNNNIHGCAASYIQIVTPSGTQQTCLINGNTINDSGVTSTGHGIYINTNDACTADGNYVYGFTDHGCISFEGAQLTAGIARNNRIFGGCQYGILINSAATGVQVYNNLVVGADKELNVDNLSCMSLAANNTLAYATTVQGEILIGTISGGCTTTIKNNIMISAGVNDCMIIGPTGFMTSDYNLFYNCPVIGTYGGNPGATLANWRTLTGGDAHSINVNPTLLNPGTGNTTATDWTFTTSPAFNAGTSISPTFTTDYFGTVRPQGVAWDIGFFELPLLNVPRSRTVFVQ